MTRRWLALVGLFVFAFSVAALSGPGRIDIGDGQTRYEVSRSLVDHGDHVIRDERVWFGVFPGREGRLYTAYRFPQSAAGVAAILVADATGSVNEGRRHFFFTLTGAFACGILAVAYAVLFRHLGHGARESLLWAGAGVFCSPTWFYATSTFDDVLGTTALVLAFALAWLSRTVRPLTMALAAGLMLGLAFNCKQPLGIYVLAVVAASYDPRTGLREQASRIALVLAGLAIGIAAYKGYDFYKFPPETLAVQAEMLKIYAPVWPGDPVAALAALAISPSTGVFFYFPPLLISLYGLRAWSGNEKWLCRSILASSVIFIGFISTISFFKGDPAWGPRYLTPVFALSWIFVPAGVRFLRRSLVVLLLVGSFVIQLGSLCVDPQRLYIEQRLPSAFYVYNPWLYFHPAISHLANRPREIIEIVARRGERAEFFTPSPSPTYTFPVLDFVDNGPEGMSKYHVLNSFRPWWISQLYLRPDQRPVDLPATFLLLVVTATLGLSTAIAATRDEKKRENPTAVSI
jgi:hypothetical protein